MVRVAANADNLLAVALDDDAATDTAIAASSLDFQRGLRTCGAPVLVFSLRERVKMRVGVRHEGGICGFQLQVLSGDRLTEI
jgi:hypothetical protein